jgi:hypothetical protein
MTEAYHANSTGGASWDDEGAAAALGAADWLCLPEADARMRRFMLHTLAILYLSTDRRWRRGAPGKNLAHSVSQCRRK